MSIRSLPLEPAEQSLRLRLTVSDLGFVPGAVWNPSPSVHHRTKPYALPRTLHVGIAGNEACGAKFSPPPFAVGIPGDEITALIHVVAEPGWHLWNLVTFAVDSPGVDITIDLEGQSDPRQVAEHVRVVVRTDSPQTPWMQQLSAALSQAYPHAYEPTTPADWWLEPMYCGWGDQVAISMWLEGLGPERRANAYCVQGLYERWIARLEQAQVPVGTITIDAGWSPAGWWKPDQERWPDLRGFIDRQHQAGRRVLLWLATWLWDGLPDEWCIFVDGYKLCADATHPGYREHLRQCVEELISPEGFDADGFKIDQLAFCPSRRVPQGGSRFGWCRTLPAASQPLRFATPGVFGCELLHQLQGDICRAAKRMKPDALITSSTVHPYFTDTFDMVRLHDMGFVTDDIFSAMRARADLARAALPHLPIDTDDWIHSDYNLWRHYTANSGSLGVPCTLYAERFMLNWKSEPATKLIALDDLHHIGQQWRQYLANLHAPTAR